MSQFFEVDPDYKKYAAKALLPSRGTERSAGYDLSIPIDVHLKPRTFKLFFTDVKVELEDNLFLFVAIRSSVALKHQVTLMNNVGIIDADYFNNENNNGNIGLPLYNHSKDDFFWPAFQPIAQGIICEFFRTVDDKVVNPLRIGGFGSTS